MRFHELAVQHWLNENFLVADGFPLPVLFSSPMDAFSNFENLWADSDNPFKYLLDLKDENGTPIYEPHPSPARLPMISVMRKGWAWRPGQNYSIHRYRHVCWETVDTAPDVKLKDLGRVIRARMPMAWDYKFQIDHFSLTPASQASFVSRMMRVFWRSGGTLQTWLTVNYPEPFSQKYVRMRLDGDIENLTPETPADDEITVYRTGCTLVVEGYEPELDYVTLPTLWTLRLRETVPADPGDLQQMFSGEQVFDLRTNPQNPVVLERLEDLPPQE
jgi:hypothetical protein